jgi:hypothetical protein
VAHRVRRGPPCRLVPALGGTCPAILFAVLPVRTPFIARGFSIVAATVLGCVAGCRDAFAPSATVAGRWVLTTVDGKPLPYIVHRSHGSVVVVADTLTLRADGTALSASARWVVFNHPSFPRVDESEQVISTGTWAQAAGDVQVTWTSGERRLVQSARHAARTRLVADSLLSGLGTSAANLNAARTVWTWSRLP